MLSDQKIKELKKRLRNSGVGHLKNVDIEHALHDPYAQGDPDKAYEIILLLEESVEGIVKEYNPAIRMLGAENRNKVTCYLDATLFAMFARLDSFEGMLYTTFEDAPRRKLAQLLRLWVNTLRVGHLITVEIVSGRLPNKSGVSDICADQTTARSHSSVRVGRRLGWWPARRIRGLCFYHGDLRAAYADAEDGYLSLGQGGNGIRSQIRSREAPCRCDTG